MTLNTTSGTPPSSLHISSHSSEASSTRRRNTFGSPASAVVFKPAAIALQQAPTVVQQPYLPLLSPGQPSHLHRGGPAAGANFRYRSKSPTPRVVSPPRRRQSSRSPERVYDQAQGPSGGGCLGNGRRNDRHLNPKSGPIKMQGNKKDAVLQSMTAPRPAFKHSPHSTSLPSTPNHQPQHLTSVSRSPSPPECLLDSPRSAASEPTTTTSSYARPRVTGCMFENLLLDAKRRIPYALGTDKLKAEKPKLEKLPEAQEETLTRDIVRTFEQLKPSEESEVRRRDFLGKLSRILNEKWPGYGTQVHAFGSTENHLCMNDSDVDVCITTRCKAMESTCELAGLLAKRGMERVICVPGAKVPIVKIWDPEYQVACDMNVNSTLALDNTRMIKTYVEIDERVRPLALIIKYWTKQRVLNNAAIGGTLSSYTWICMILNFLQTREPPVLPSLHMLPHKKKPPNHGVDVSFADDIEELRGWGKNNKETLGGLLFAFFKKYGHEMDYEKKVISVRAGKLLSKEDKGWQYLQNNRLCVEEPFNTGRNLGNTADECTMKGIHLEFRRAHKILAEKADLAECCEQFEYPPETIHHAPPPQVPSRPVTLSRSNSNHGRARNGYSSVNQRGGSRGFGQYNNRNNQNRRGSSGAAAFNQNMVQSQYYAHDNSNMFGYVPSANDQLLALQAQIQGYAHVQAQIAHAAQLHQAAQAQAQLHNQHQNGTQSAPSLPANGSTNSHQVTDPFWPYFANMAQLYGMNMFYSGFPQSQNTTNSETSAPTSPPRTPAMADSRSSRGTDGSRMGMNCGSHASGVYTNGARSHSQPPPLYAANGYPIPTVGVLGTEDDEFADHSSNGNPPETPPEDEPDEYVGYYTIGGSLQPDVAVVDPHVGDEEEPFLEQKTAVDRQKRFSHEKLPPPLLVQSRGTSPVSANRRKHDVSVPMDPHLETQQPVIVNGDVPLHAYASSVPGDAATSNGTNSSSGQKQQLFVQNAFKVHNQSLSVRSNGVAVESQEGSQETSFLGSVPLSPATVSVSAGSTSECESESIDSPRLSPSLRQRGAPKQVIWAHARNSSLDPTSKSFSSSQDDPVASPLTPVLEDPTPPPQPVTTKKGSNKSSSEKSPQKSQAKKSIPKDDPIPPTPVPSTSTSTSTNTTQKGGHRHSKNSGKAATAIANGNKKKDGAEIKPEQKPANKGQWQKPKKKKKAQSGTTKEAAVKESERKGG